MQSNNKYRLTIWFVIFLSFLNAQENPPYKIDTIWHSNGQVQSIYEINSENQFCGFYKEFDTLGNIYYEGNSSLKIRWNVFNAMTAHHKFIQPLGNGNSFIS